MAVLHPREDDGPIEVERFSDLVVVLLPLEGGGRLRVDLDDDEASELLHRLALLSHIAPKS